MNKPQSKTEPPDLYWLWYEFLKLNDQNDPNWNPQVYKDFKGVFEMEFEDWFRAVRFDLFAPLGPILGDGGKWWWRRPVTRLMNVESAKHINFDTHLVLVIDRSHPLSDLKKRVMLQLERATGDDEEIVDGVAIHIPSPQKVKKRGSPEFKQSFARYPFEAKPDAWALKQVLQLYKFRKKNPKIEPLYNVGVEAKKLPEFDWLLRNIKVEKGLTTEDEEKIGQEVSRLLARAEKIKAGVAKGKFPVTK